MKIASFHYLLKLLFLLNFYDKLLIPLECCKISLNIYFEEEKIHEKKIFRDFDVHAGTDDDPCSGRDDHTKQSTTK
jgi:hypothetical protein